ncbi:MAG TPA: NADP-dependent phosphogluconate dehydrogenase [Candidatus Binatia bacterium]|nr:NADP-dependent phosphogluconate dehydrogenase [Candidatus Binatia bacterium]
MKIAIAGLGKMGMQIAHSLTRDGHQVLAQNRSPEKVDEAVKFGAVAAYTPADVAKAFGDEPAVVWLMVPAEVVSEELEVWLGVLKPRSIIIDGGNSDFRSDSAHYEQVKAKGLELIDCGTSGGILGYDNGFSMMVGGEPEAVAKVAPAFDSLAKPKGAWHHFGPIGAGHFVKMVHNAIEYGVMESLAEGYRMLREGPYKAIDLAAAGQVWQHGSIIESSLNELTRQAINENPTLDGIDGVVAESGETRWTLELADKLGLSMPSIKAAFDVRLASQKGEVNFATKILAAQRNKFGGHAINPDAK